LWQPYPRSLPLSWGAATNIALPPIGREFEIDAILLGWIATSYLLTAGIFSVPFGRIADIKGRKRIFIVGLLVILRLSVSYLRCKLLLTKYS